MNAHLATVVCSFEAAARRIEPSFRFEVDRSQAREGRVVAYARATRAGVLWEVGLELSIGMTELEAKHRLVEACRETLRAWERGA